MYKPLTNKCKENNNVNLYFYPEVAWLLTTNVIIYLSKGFNRNSYNFKLLDNWNQDMVV